MNLSAQPFDVSKVSVNALKVVARLVEHGYQAYLVGGCVRDILLGKSPKDFDVATDAHPDEVRELFRNSRIVGRRFCIVHARFGRELVEITTFRGPHEDKYEANHTESGMTVSDNIYGTFKEDVFRRDFTVNAIYYQPQSDELVDMAEGNADIAARTLRTLGAPEARFREDPVRMLRAIRFKAKLGFDIDTEAEASVRSQGQLIQDVPPARLFEEVLKLFMAGFAERAFNCLMEYGLYGWLFPDSKRALDDEPMAAELVRLALASTDRRIAEGLPVTPAFIYAAILWFPFLAERQRLSKTGMAPMEASLEAANGIIGKQQLFTSIPRRFSGPVRDIWFLQFRLPFRTGKKPEQVMAHKRFRAAYDFLLLREESGELGKSSVGSWWTEYQEATEEDRAA
ncbi:MAG: polynucleotide adenylyltransferase PcnB, partial [Pseudomonadales bacterium]